MAAAMSDLFVQQFVHEFFVVDNKALVGTAADNAAFVPCFYRKGKFAAFDAGELSSCRNLAAQSRGCSVSYFKSNANAAHAFFQAAADGAAGCFFHQRAHSGSSKDGQSAAAHGDSGVFLGNEGSGGAGKAGL